MALCHLTAVLCNKWASESDFSWLCHVPAVLIHMLTTTQIYAEQPMTILRGLTGELTLRCRQSYLETSESSAHEESVTSV